MGKPQSKLQYRLGHLMRVNPSFFFLYTMLLQSIVSPINMRFCQIDTLVLSRTLQRRSPFCVAVMGIALGCILMMWCKLGHKVRTPQLGDAFVYCLVYGMLTHGRDSHSQIS